jgi:hypothetical protein
MPDEELAESSTAETEAKEESESSEPQSEASQTEKTDAEPESAEESETPEASESKKDESVSSPEEAKRPEAKRNAETRIKQLTAKMRAMERQMSAMQTQTPQTTPITKEPVRPKLSDFDTVEAFEAANEQYDVNVRKFAAEKAIIERDQKARQEADQKTVQEAISAFNKRAERIAKENPDFNVREYSQAIDPNPTTDGFLLESDVGPEILSYLYENPEEAELRGLPPFKCARELFKLESKFSDQVKGIKKPVAKPPNYVSGKGASVTTPKSAADIIYS